MPKNLWPKMIVALILGTFLGCKSAQKDPAPAAAPYPAYPQTTYPTTGAPLTYSPANAPLGTVPPVSSPAANGAVPGGIPR